MLTVTFNGNDKTDVLSQIEAYLSGEAGTGGSATVVKGNAAGAKKQPTIKLDDIRSAMMNLDSVGGTPEQKKGLVEKYGTKLSDVKESDYALLMADIKGLHASLDI